MASAMNLYYRSFILFLCGCLIVTLCSGSSGGRAFFSPDTLEYRFQSEYLMRETGFPMFRSPYEYRKDELVEFLENKGYWNPRVRSSPRWILLLRWNHMWKDGDTEFYRYFFRRKSFWIEWSNREPDHAARFWPKILDLLRSDREDRAAEVLAETADLDR
jgi:hypothetical protein